MPTLQYLYPSWNVITVHTLLPTFSALASVPISILPLLAQRPNSMLANPNQLPKTQGQRQENKTLKAQLQRMRSNAYLQSHACIRKTLQRRNKPARRRQVFYKVANSKIYLPRNQQLSYEPALELENMIFFFFGTKKNLPCFLWLSFQEKLASNTLDWKLVLGTSGGSSIRHLGRDQVLRLWLCLKLNAGICFPGGRDCSVNLMKSGSPEPHRAC